MTFRFTIRDLGIFLHKSPVTIRNWERKGLLRLPRVGKNRVLTTHEVRATGRTAFERGRISQERLALIAEALNLLEQLELEDE